MTASHNPFAPKRTSKPKRNSTKQVFFTELEAASFLRFSAKYLQRMRAEKRGPAFIRLDRSVRYRRSDLVRWMELRRENGAQR